MTHLDTCADLPLVTRGKKFLRGIFSQTENVFSVFTLNIKVMYDY